MIHWNLVLCLFHGKRQLITSGSTMSNRRGEWKGWPCGLRPCDRNCMVPGSNPTKRSGEFSIQPPYEAPRDLRAEAKQTQ